MTVGVEYLQVGSLSSWRRVSWLSLCVRCSAWGGSPCTLLPAG